VICPGSTATEFSGRAPNDPSRALGPEDVAHAVETIVTQGPRSFISEIHVRPLRKTVAVSQRPADFFLLTIVVITTILSP